LVFIIFIGLIISPYTSISKDASLFISIVGIFFGRGPNLGPPTFIAGFCTLTPLSYLIIGATISSYNYETNSYLYFN
jgi:hypothetical protein